MEKKTKNNKASGSIKIDPITYFKLKKHCDRNGAKINKLASIAIDHYLKSLVIHHE